MKPRMIAVCALLVLATLVAYGTLGRNEFVNLDDNVYITGNEQVRRGLSAETFAWAFASQEAGNWHPLTWLSHLLDVSLYGMDPAGHHATNLVLHLLSTAVLFLALRRMTGDLWPSAFVAAIFALHPLHVESVAWASERKDVLSGLFWMLTLWAYALYVERPGARRYLLVVAALVLGLMAKPMLVTLPFVLLLLDYWPLGRLGGPADLGRRLLEKLPLLALSAASSAVTFLVQQRGGAVEDVSLDLRLANAIVTYVGYAVKMFWPSPLAPLYPFPLGGIPAWKVALCAAILAAATAGALYLGRTRRYLATGWLWYLGTLVPVIGVIQVGYQGSADRYTYIPSIGLSVVLAWAGAEAVARWRLRPVWVALPVGAALALMASATRAQVGLWRDTLTLYEHTLDVTEGNYMMYANLGVTQVRSGALDSAIENLRKAVQARPDFDHGHYNLAVALTRQGRLDEAIEHYRRTLEVTPDYANAHYNLANILNARGESAEALGHYRSAVSSRPDFLRARLALGRALYLAGEWEEGIRQFEEAVRRSPNSADAHDQLGQALAGRGREQEAARHAARARELRSR